jgi:hypothetical protein
LISLNSGLQKNFKSTLKIRTELKKFKSPASHVPTETDGKGLSQPACPRGWKKCEEENE